MRWAHIHEKENWTLATLPLAFFSLLYGLGIKLRSRRQVRKSHLPGFVVSLGNVTVGGTGKTPAAAMLARWALEQGYKPAILSRGYGGNRKEKILEVADGRVLRTSPAKAGDEPCLLARKLKGVPVILSRNRFDAGVLAHEKHGADFFILDDGYQHVHLHRDLDMVLIDATRPFGNMHLLPWGPLREPLENLNRADAFVITRSDGGSALILMDFLKSRFPEKPVFRSYHMPEKILFPRSWKSFRPAFLLGKKVVAFAGIAKPTYFRDTLVKLGAEVLLFKEFPDHYAFSRADIEALILSARHADCLMTTEKDWVRIEDLGIHEDKLCYLTVSFELLPDGESFFQMVEQRARAAKGRKRPDDTEPIAES